jgi:acetyltransferase-like isoleucine patch superfamily enzyme
MISDLIRHISGSLGIRLRRVYYKRLLKSAGSGLVIETGVFLHSPGDISVGDQVWIDKNCILIAGKLPEKKKIKRVNDGDDGPNEGEIQIGSNSHLGIGTIIQGHGGIRLQDDFTSSAGCKIYSFSNDYRNCRNGTNEAGAQNSPAYILGPVRIGRNAWLGLNVSVLSTNIGDDVFIMPHSVVSRPIAKNTVAQGSPAVSIHDRFES